MSYKNIIINTIEFIRDFYKDDASGHDFLHSHRVFALTKKIGEQENVNSVNMELAALLHDVDDYKKSKSKEMFITKQYLKNMEVSASDIEDICGIIQEVSFAGNHKVPSSIYAKIVQDADRLDAIGAIGVARAFAYGGAKGQKIYDPNIKVRNILTEKNYYNEKTTSINHFYEKLLKLSDYMNTCAARNMAIKRHEFLEKFLKQFQEECLEAEIK